MSNDEFECHSASSTEKNKIYEVSSGGLQGE